MDHHQHPSEAPGRGRRLLASAALLCLGSAALSLGTSSTSSPVEPSAALDAAIALSESRNDPFDGAAVDINGSGRQLSVALPHGGCQVTYAHLAEVDIPPTWQASFPGSGSRMTWSLVEALTGIRTNDDYDSHGRGYERVVAVKTHYPVKDAKRKFKQLDKKFGRAIVILRNPINAIPSYFNLQYEHLNHLPNHSTRGPNEDWIKYREHPGYGVAAQLANYEQFVSYWLERFANDRQNLLLVSYEDLADNSVGPLVAARIANFLGQVEGVNPIVPESVPCVWETIVNYKNVAPPASKAEALASDRGRKTVRRKAKEGGGADGNAANVRRRLEAKNVDLAPYMEPSQKGARRQGQDRTEDAKVAGRILKKQNVSDKASKRLKAAKKEEKEEIPPGVARNMEERIQGKTHADPSSLRSGPKVRPYSEQMLGDMVAMFQKLLERYGRDEDLMRIMASYIETVSKTPVEEGYPQN